MNAVCLRIYTHGNETHLGLQVHEWLLEQARKLGVPGGSAFHALAGYGCHHALHEQHFFELAGNAPILVEFIASEAQADAILALLAEQALRLFHTRHPVEQGISGGGSDVEDPGSDRG